MTHQYTNKFPNLMWEISGVRCMEYSLASPQLNTLATPFYLSFSDHSHHCHSLNLRRVLAIVPHVKKETGECPHDIELETLNPVNHYSSFYLHIIVKKGNHKWQHRKFLFECPSFEVGSKWFTRIQNTLKGITSLPSELQKFIAKYKSSQ